MCELDIFCKRSVCVCVLRSGTRRFFSIKNISLGSFFLSLQISYNSIACVCTERISPFTISIRTTALVVYVPFFSLPIIIQQSSCEVCLEISSSVYVFPSSPSWGGMVDIQEGLICTRRWWWRNRRCRSESPEEWRWWITRGSRKKPEYRTVSEQRLASWLCQDDEDSFALYSLLSPLCRMKRLLWIYIYIYICTAKILPIHIHGLADIRVGRRRVQVGHHDVFSRRFDGHFARNVGG